MAGMTVVISQSMYFPWVGLLEQIRLADAFIHYDDVQFVRGFLNRVQVKTAQGTKWMTVPTKDRHRGQSINNVLIDDREPWRKTHRNLLAEAYRGAPYVREMLDVVDHVFSQRAYYLSDVTSASIQALCTYFELDRNTNFLNSEDLGVGGASSQRLKDLTLAVQGDVYLTGHGARNYLDHALFEADGIDVHYMNYERIPYPQLHGDFTPYVTGLDLIANCGREGRKMIRSGSLYWREFLNEPR